VALALGACAAFCLPSPASAAASGCKRSLPVVAHRADGIAVRLPEGARLPVACAAETGLRDLRVEPRGEQRRRAVPAWEL